MNNIIQCEVEPTNKPRWSGRKRKGLGWGARRRRGKNEKVIAFLEETENLIGW